MHLFDGVDQICQAFQRKVLALHRHNHAMGAAQAVECQHAQGRRAVNQDKVVIVSDFSQRQFEALFTPLHIHQLHLSTRQLAIRTQNVITATTVDKLLADDFCLLDRRGLQQYVVHRVFEFAFVHARTHGGVSLRVQVNHQHALAYFGQASRQIDGGSGFADPTFLIGNAEDFGHLFLLFLDKNVIWRLQALTQSQSEKHQQLCSKSWIPWDWHEYARQKT